MLLYSTTNAADTKCCADCNHTLEVTLFIVHVVYQVNHANTYA